MRLSKFLTTLTTITFFALLYVHQQTEIFRLAYLGQKRTVEFQDLLDKNNILRYNIGKSSSLIHIGSKVSETADFQMPDTYRLVKIAYASPNLSLSRQRAAKDNIFVRIFGANREAQAKTINSSIPSGVNKE